MTEQPANPRSQARARTVRRARSLLVSDPEGIGPLPAQREGLWFPESVASSRQRPGQQDGVIGIIGTVWPVYLAKGFDSGRRAPRANGPSRRLPVTLDPLHNVGGLRR